MSRGVENGRIPQFTEETFSSQQIAGLAVAQEALRPDYALSLLQKLAEKSTWTYLHSLRVGLIVGELTELVDLSSSDKVIVTRAGFVHDVGKRVVSNAILDKNGINTDEEFQVQQIHPIEGYNMILSADPTQDRVAKVVIGHHEHQGDRSYRRKSVEEIAWPPDRERRTVDPDILLMQRMVAVADTVDALGVRRPYPSWDVNGKGVLISNEDWSPEKIYKELDRKFSRYFSADFLWRVINEGQRIARIPQLHQS